jgi:F-type H+-transporting ATPase subunit epsilon
VGKSFRLRVLTPDRTEFEGDVVSVIAPGESGYLGVLVDHAPLVTTLGAGKLLVRDDRGNQPVMILKDGFMEVFKNTVTILAESCQKPGESDEVSNLRVS